MTAAPDLSSRDDLASCTVRELLALARAKAQREGTPTTSLLSLTKSQLLSYLYGETAEPAPAAAAAAPPAAAPPADAAGRLRDALADLIGPQRVDTDALRAELRADAERAARDAASEAVAGLTRTIRVEIAAPGEAPRTIEGAHARLADVLAEVNAARAVGAPANILLTGPAGVGKSTLAAHVADALGAALVSVACSEETGARHFFGRRGLQAFEGTAFLAGYESPEPVVLLLDEIDALLPAVGVALNAALANGSFGLPEREAAPLARRGAAVVVIAAANTYGTGPDAVYCGRNALDAATLDRWSYLSIDYDPGIEDRIAAAHGATKALAALRTVREAISAHKLRRVASTRALLRIAGRIATGAASDGGAVVRAELAGRGWTAAELAKAGL